MIPIPSGARVWIATGQPDMRRYAERKIMRVNEGHVSATEVSPCRLQQMLKRDPRAGDLFVFRGRRGNFV
jgi:transposase